jgi:RNA-directed DNA polymerase
LRPCWHDLNKDAASRGAKVTAAGYAAHLHTKREAWAQRLQTQRDRAKLGRRCSIPKEHSQERPLGIPAVLDRVIQQAIAPVIRPLLEPHFHPHSYGFRPGRRARRALAEREEAHREGRRYTAAGDLKSFLDPVNHRVLMNQLARRMTARRVLRPIGRYRRAGGILPEGSREPTPCGVPPGGPLSPLLAHEMLDDLAVELERRGLRFARDADDLLIFMRSQQAARRVVRRISRFIERH